MQVQDAVGCTIISQRHAATGHLLSSTSLPAKACTYQTLHTEPQASGPRSPQAASSVMTAWRRCPNACTSAPRARSAVICRTTYTHTPYFMCIRTYVHLSWQDEIALHRHARGPSMEMTPRRHSRANSLDAFAQSPVKPWPATVQFGEPAPPSSMSGGCNLTVMQGPRAPSRFAQPARSLPVCMNGHCRCSAAKGDRPCPTSSGHPTCCPIGAVAAGWGDRVLLWCL